MHYVDDARSSSEVVVTEFGVLKRRSREYRCSENQVSDKAEDSRQRRLKVVKVPRE